VRAVAGWGAWCSGCRSRPRGSPSWCDLVGCSAAAGAPPTLVTAKAIERSDFCETESTGVAAAPKLLQFEQHRDRPLQLSVEVDFVARQAFKPARLFRIAKSLRTDQRPVHEFAPSVVVPGNDFGLQKSRHALGIGRVGSETSVHIIGDGASELILIRRAVLSFRGTIDYFINTVSNCTTWRNVTRSRPLTVSTGSASFRTVLLPCGRTCPGHPRL
jgi:hypothetical protein